MLAPKMRRVRAAKAAQLASAQRVKRCWLKPELAVAKRKTVKRNASLQIAEELCGSEVCDFTQPISLTIA